MFYNGTYNMSGFFLKQNIKHKRTGDMTIFF